MSYYVKMVPYRTNIRLTRKSDRTIVLSFFVLKGGNSMKKEMDMLHGPLASKILLFAIPLACTGILQQLFNAADVMVIGRFVGKHAMAAVGSNSAFIGLMVNLFVGISLGANVIIARYTGQGNKEKVHQAVHMAILVALIGGIIMTVVGETVTNPLLVLLGVPDEVFALARLYLRVYLLGMPVILLYNFESAIFRSQGNTKTPLICLTISGCVNVVFNLFFVLVCGRSVDGVALGTVLSNAISSVLLFILLVKSPSEVRIRKADMHLHKDVLKEMFRIGLPAGLQGCVFSISNIMVQSAINSLGADIMASSSAAFNIEIMAYYLANSFGQACTTFIGQNHGAGNLERCKSVTHWSLFLATISTAIVSVLVVIFAPDLIRIFNSDPTVIENGAIRLYWIVGFECINMLIELFSGCMRGYGYSLVPALVALIGICGVRIIWIYTIFAAHHTFGTLMVVYPFSWVVTSIVLIGVYFVFMKKVLIKEFA